MSSNHDNKRVLVLTSTFPRWKNDTEPSFVHELCQRLSKSGFSLDILAPHTQGAKTNEAMESLTVYRYRYFIERYEKLAYQGGIMANIQRNKLFYLLVPFFILAQLIHTYKLLKNNHYDLVHSHWVIPQGLIAILANRMNVKNSSPVIVTSHGSDFFTFNKGILKVLQNWTISRLNQLVVVSQFLKSCYQRHLKCKKDIEVCSMGVDLTHRFIPKEVDIDKSHRLIFVGRLVEKKGLGVLLKALRILIDQKIDFQLDIIGDGPEKENIEELISSLKLKNHVFVLGARQNEELPDYYQSAAIAVIPSIIGKDNSQEGLGLTVIEAMGCECAVVASRLEAISEIVIDGETGILCNPADEQDLAEKIQSLLLDKPLREKIATAGRKRVLQQFDWQQITEKYAKIYKKSIKSID